MLILKLPKSIDQQQLRYCIYTLIDTYKMRQNHEQDSNFQLSLNNLKAHKKNC